MTSAEVWPADYEAEVVDEPTESAGGEGDSQSGPVTPWSGKQGHKSGPRTGTGPANPGSGTSPGQNGTSPSSGQNGAPATPPGQAGKGGSGQGSTAPQGNVVAPPATPPGQPAQPPAAQPAPQSQSAPAEPAPPLVDPDTVAALAPVALSAGTMALGVLPMLASALAGLGRGGGGGGSGSGTATGSDGSSGGDGSEGGLSPEAQKALQALKLLAAVYGDGKTDDPEVKQLRQQLGINGSGSGATAIRARQLFQKNAATAFNNLDNQLASYISGLAGDHKVDKKAVTALIREVNVALAELGPQAYTKAGRQKVHEILTTALQNAHQIVSGTQESAAATANAINRLTNQYLYNIAGKKYAGGISGQMPGGVTGQMPGGTVGEWIKQALQVLQQLGYDISKIDPQAIAIIIQYESGGNPNAINNYDSNAAAGTPSIGLMQVIGPTFNQYAAPGHTNIYHPVDNIVAGVRYAIARYGSVSNVPGVEAVRNGGPYKGY